jgi:hypothetical protein
LAFVEGSAMTRDRLGTGGVKPAAALGSNVPRWLTIIGDPTLRLKMPTPVSGFTATYTNSNFTLTWNALAALYPSSK